MSDFKNEWTELQPYEKVCHVLGMVLALAVIVLGVFAVLQSLRLIVVKVSLLPICLILLGLENLFNALYAWRRTRGTAIVSLICGVFVLLCAVIGLFLMN